MTPLEIAIEYIKRGWNPLPIPYKSKKPTISGWQNLIIRENDAAKFFNGSPQNIGIQLGATSSGLTDFDLDCTEAIAIAPVVLPKTGAIFGSVETRQSLALFVNAGDYARQGRVEADGPDQEGSNS